MAMEPGSAQLAEAIRLLAEQVDVLQAQFQVVVDEVMEMKRRKRQQRVQRRRAAQ